MGYLYETHLHTCQGSKCGRSEGKEYPAIYKALGYDGIFVTDHFFGGNTAVPKDLPWSERVSMYMSGYYDAKEAGDRIGFPVFFGIEQNYLHDEYLIYGIDEEFLLRHPDIEEWPRSQLMAEVHAYGGCAVQAHPFRERPYIKKVKLSPFTVDGIEAANIGNEPGMDLAAMSYAKTLGLPMTAGSDRHSIENLQPERFCGTETEEPISSSRHYAEYILSRKPLKIKYPEGRFEGAELRHPTLEVEVYGRNDEIVATDAEEYLKWNLE